MHILCVDADTSVGKMELKRRALYETMKVYTFFQKIKGLENITIDFIAEETGVRETNRVAGETVITENEYLSGTFYPDFICYAWYPVALHIMDGLIQKYHKEKVIPKVPYSALIPKNSERILCAGRCISSDTLANSGLRAQANCMATGQVVGCAAALAAKNNLLVKEISYIELRNSLEAIGAILP